MRSNFKRKLGYVKGKKLVNIEISEKLGYVKKKLVSIEISGKVG